MDRKKQNTDFRLGIPGFQVRFSSIFFRSFLLRPSVADLAQFFELRIGQVLPGPWHFPFAGTFQKCLKLGAKNGEKIKFIFRKANNFTFYII